MIRYTGISPIAVHRDTALALALVLHDVSAAKDTLYYGRKRVPSWVEIAAVKPMPKPEQPR